MNVNAQAAAEMEDARYIRGSLYKIGRFGYVFRMCRDGTWQRSALTLAQFNGKPLPSVKVLSSKKGDNTV